MIRNEIIEMRREEMRREEMRMNKR